MKSFRIVDTKFRILSKGRVGMFASIAVGAMMTIGASSAHADWNLVSTTNATTAIISLDAAYTYHNNSVGSSSGLLATSGSNDFTYTGDTDTDGIGGSDGYRANIGYGTGATYIDTYIQAPTLDQVAFTATNGTYKSNDGVSNAWVVNYDNLIDIASGTDITGATYGTAKLAIYAGYGAYTSDEDLGVGVNTQTDYQVVSLNDATLNIHGNNTINGIVGYSTYDGNSGRIGTINLLGNDVTFGDTVYATTVNIYTGTNNTNVNDFRFNGPVDASDLNFYQAASVLLNGGLTGNLNYNGNNSIVTLGANQSIGGNVTTTGINGTLIFQGEGTVAGDVVTVVNSSLEEVRANGTGNVLFTAVAPAEVDHVNYQAAALIGFNGGLDLSVDTSDQGVNTVTFNNHDGVLQINNGDLTGIEGQAVVTTTGNNIGTVTMISGTQDIVGNIGSNGHAIKTLNIGGFADGAALGAEDGTNYSTTAAYGDVYATNTVLNNNSTTNNSSLIMTTDYDLYSTVTTADNGAGVLTLAGGVQNVTGNVGTNGMRLDQVNSGANGATSNFGSSGTPTDVYADTVSNTGTGTTNFSRNVTATTINVASGISNFTNNVSATTTNIGTGVANFNTNGTGTTNTDIVFTADKTNSTTSDQTGNVAGLGSATANIMNSLTGNVNFAGHNAVVNVWHEPITWADPFDYNAYTPASITGDITTTTSNTGIVNFRGAGIIDGAVGASNMGIAQLNINTNNEQSGYSGYEWREVLAKADIYAGSVNLKNDAILKLEDGVNITGTGNSGSNVTALTGTQQVISTDVAGTGTLYLNGSSTITGVVGANNMALGTIHAMANGSTVVFNNMVYADTLWANDNTIVFNGQAGLQADGTAGTSANSTIAGMKGTIDFDGDGAGTIEIGDNVNITTGVNGIQFVDAKLATLTFDGTSSVHGDVGSLNGTDTFKVINAGVNTETVTFNNNVYFMDSLNLSNDGTVEIADGKYARRNSTSATTGAIVTTTTNGEGNLVYQGGTTLYGDIGTSAAMLKSVTFNSASDEVTQNIGHNVYADTVTVGGTSGTTALSLADVTGVYDYAGATTMKEYRGGTAANITADVTLGGDLIIANDTSAINFGKSHVTIGIKHDGVTAGNFETNGGAMSFTVNTLDISNNYTGTGTSTSTDSALVSVSGNLVMDGDEQVHINYVGSLANSGSYTVINATGGTTANGTVNTVVAGAYNQNESGNVSDNSFSIDSRVATNASGDLIVYADRTGAASGSTYAANENYIQKSDTVGHFSNNAGIVLGGIAAAGDQTGDMVQVIQKMDIDSFGYGNNQQNLETQVKRLAPIANASLSQAAIGANTLTLNTVSNRIADLRGDSIVLPSTGRTGMSAGDESAKNGAWVKLIASTATQDQDGMYDGYKTRSGGLAMGIDHKFSYDITAGLAFGYTRTNVDQKDFRSGDSANTNSYNIVAYASKDFERAYVEGALSYAHHDTDSHRATAVGRTAQADIDANQYTAHLSAGYRFNVKDKATVTPFLALDYTHLAQDAYTETGAGAINLDVDALSTNRTTFGGGLRVGTKYDNGSTVLRPELKLAAYHISGGSNTDISAQYVGGGEKFVTPGTDLNNMMYNIGLGLKAQINDATSLGLTVDYDRSSNGLFEGYTGQLVGRYEF